MSKAIDHNSMDAATLDIMIHATRLLVLSGDPAGVYATAVNTLALGGVSIGTPAFTQQNGLVSGRRLTVAQQTIASSISGSGTYICLVDDVNSRIKATDITTPAYSMVAGVNVANPQYDCWEIEDPT